MEYSIEQEKVYGNRSGTTELFRNYSGEYYLMKLSGDPELEDYQTVFYKLLGEVNKVPYSKVVFDLKQLEATGDDTLQWLSRQLVPETLQKVTGYLRNAIVQPKNNIQRCVLDRITKSWKSLGESVEIQYFETLSEAKAWVM